MIIDGVIELDDEEFEDHRPELVDLARDYWQRIVRGHPERIDLMIELLAAANDLCGLQLTDPEEEWDAAYRELRRAHWLVRSRDGQERGDYFFNVQFRAAIARWEKHIAAADTE